MLEEGLWGAYRKERHRLLINCADRNKAIKLYRMASDRGSARAQVNLASNLLEDGDLESAFHYYRLSAEGGLLQAQYNIGVCYGHGAGVEADPVEARRWLERAAAGGYQAARETIERMDRAGV